MIFERWNFILYITFFRELQSDVIPVVPKEALVQCDVIHISVTELLHAKGIFPYRERSIQANYIFLNFYFSHAIPGQLSSPKLVTVSAILSALLQLDERQTEKQAPATPGAHQLVLSTINNFSWYDC